MSRSCRGSPRLSWHPAAAGNAILGALKAARCFITNYRWGDAKGFRFEAESDGGRFIQPVQLAIPVNRLVLVPDADRHLGQILVAVAVLDGEGNTAPAHLVRLRLAIPSDRYSEDAVAVQRIRLLMRDGTRRIAVSVRDEVSGIEASQAVAISGEVPGGG